METLNEYLNASPDQRRAEAERRGWNTRPHQGPDNWAADMAQSNRRAFAALAALRNQAPRPIWGRRNARKPND